MKTQFKVGDRVKVLAWYEHDPVDGDDPRGKIGTVKAVDKDIGWAWVDMGYIPRGLDDMNEPAETWMFDYGDIALVEEG